MKETIKKFIPKKIIKFLKYIFRKERLVRNSKFVISFSDQEKTLNCLIAYNQHGGFCIPVSSKHRPASQTIMKGKIYEPDTISYIIDHMLNGDVVHAGTFFGDFLPPISGAFSANQKLWAFEPNFENYNCARITTIINSLDNVELLHFGLGEFPSTKKILIKDEKGISLGGGSRILDETESIQGKAVDINVIALDDIIPKDRNITIIQLDVEGYEKQALAGAIETIKRCKPILILEDNNNVINSSWFDQNLKALNYKVIGKVHENTILKTNTYKT